MKKSKENMILVDMVFLPLLEKMDLTPYQQKEIMKDVREVLDQQESTIYKSPNFVTGLQIIDKKLKPARKIEELQYQIQTSVLNWKSQDEKIKKSEKVFQNKLKLIHKEYGTQEEIYSKLLKNEPKLGGYSDFALQVFETSAEEKYEANVKKGLSELEGKHFHDPMDKENHGEIIAIQVIDLAKANQKVKKYKLVSQAEEIHSKQERLKQLKKQIKSNNNKSISKSIALKP